MKKLALSFVVCALLLVSTLALANPVNINTADAQTLATLTGIGSARAEAIIKDREEKGAFSTPGELIRVPGIGPSILSANSDRIVVSDD